MRASSSWPSASESRARSAEPREESLARALDFGAQPQLQLAGGLLGEGHGDDSVELGAPARERRDDPADQRGGLAGAGGGLDEERGVEVVADAVAHALVGNSRGAPLAFDILPGRPVSVPLVKNVRSLIETFPLRLAQLAQRSIAARRAAGFSATRVSSYGPQTIR